MVLLWVINPSAISLEISVSNTDIGFVLPASALWYFEFFFEMRVSNDDISNEFLFNMMVWLSEFNSFKRTVTQNLILSLKGKRVF